MSDAKTLPKIPLICDRLPDCICVMGQKYRILTDFRRWIIVSQILESNIRLSLKTEFVIKTVCPSLKIPTGAGDEFYISFFNEILSFALRGKPDLSGRKGEKSRDTEKSFDFSADADLIYAAFYSVYGIDLDTAPLHWWKFLALLTSLPYDCELMRVIALRRTDLGGIKDDDMRKKLRRAKAAVRIRQN